MQHQPASSQLMPSMRQSFAHLTNLMSTLLHPLVGVRLRSLIARAICAESKAWLSTYSQYPMFDVLQHFLSQHSHESLIHSTAPIGRE
eukprot:5258503-Amphidinium_carterae.1